MKFVRSASIVGTILVLLVTASCSHRRPRHVSSHISRGERVQEGVSSWYGKKFDGKPTASGQIFDMYGLSAAHRTLPLGTKVRVTNLDNDKSVVLTINDRGPFVRGRILDCSYGAAKKLGFVGAGLAPVRIEVLSGGDEKRHYTPPPGQILAAGKTPEKDVLDGSFTVQVGAFHNPTNALRLRDKLREAFSDAYVIRFHDFYRVRVGHLSSEDAADGLLSQLNRLDLNGFVTRND